MPGRPWTTPGSDAPLKQIVSSLYQTAGLKLINRLAATSAGAVTVHRYGTGSRQVYDCYAGAGAGAGSADFRPAVVFIYGGNWQSGHRRDYRFVADTLRGLGYTVYVPDYRLYPEVRFGEIIRDVRDAVDTILTHHGDGPVFLMGHSAGAQMGALLTLNHELLGRPGNICGFVGLAGPYDFYPFTEDSHWDLFAPEDRYPESQAVNYVNPDAPPLYLLHGRDDNRVRRGHSKSLMEKQLAAGGEARREVYDRMGHVDILLSFTRIHRRRSRVLRDIDTFMTEILARNGQIRQYESV